MRKYGKYLPFLIVLVVVMVIVSVRSAYHSQADSPRIVIPSSLSGEWHQTEGMKNVYMTATIHGGSIQIDMENRDATYVYWMGTFESDKSTAMPFTTVSLGDTDAMAQSVFGSNSKMKTFTYKDGVISYDFTMLGSFKTVKLMKNKTAPKPKVTHTVDIPGMGRTYTPKVVPAPTKPVPRVQAPDVKIPAPKR